MLWIENSYEARDIAPTFEPVKPRDFTFDFLESNRRLQLYFSFVSLFTVDAFHYYLPSLMALCIEDYKRAGALPDVLLHRLHRIPPFVKSIDKWVEEAGRLPVQAPGEDSSRSLLHELELLKDWFFGKSDPNCIESICRLRDEEKQAVVSFVDYLETTSDFKQFETTAARAMLLNGSLANRLGASRKEEVDELLNVVDLITVKFSQHFNRDLADEHKTRLIIDRATM